MRWLPPLLLLLAWAALVVSVGPPAGDIANYLTAASLWSEGADLGRLYDYRWFTAQAARVGFPGQLVGFAVLTPPSALLLAPLLPLGIQGAVTAWWALQALLGVALAAALGALALPDGRWSGRLGLGLALLLLAGPALESHLRQGQLHLPAVLCLGLGLLAWRGRREGWAGLLLGLAVGLKVHAWPLLALAAVLRRWRVLGVALATLGAGGVVSVALLGWPVHATYLTEIGPAAAAGRFIDPWSPAFSSVGHLARGLLLPHPALNPDAPAAAPAWAAAVPAAVQALVVGLTVVAGARAGRLGRVGRGRLVAAAGVAALASGPLLARYHLLLVLPLAALALGLSRQEAHPRRRVLLLLALLLALFWAPAPATWSPGWARLFDLPRLAAALGFWAALVPWARRPLGGGGLALVAALALAAGARAGLGTGEVDDGAELLDAPGVPLIAADLQVEGDRLTLSGLPGAGHPAGGGGWVRLSVDPTGGPPTWSATPGQHAFAAPTAPGEAAAVPGPGGGRVEVRAAAGQTDLWWVPREGAAERLTDHPGHDVSPAWDPARQRLWFLSDRGAGVRALRVWWLPWSPR